MTVKELITELNKIEDKDMPVKVYADMQGRNVTGIYTDNLYNSVCFRLERIELDYFDF
jgi:hypothetical protein